MASLERVSKLLEDVICPICKEILQDPVTTDCGHNFCLQCINQVVKTTENPQCPLCKLPVDKNVFRPNKLLASLAEKFLAIDSVEVQSEEEEPRCRKHKEKFNYFCEEDGEFLCRECHDSKDHKTHKVTVIDEAAQNYKVQIETQLRDLGQKDKEIIKEKKEGEGAIQVFRAQVHLEKLKILEEFKHVRQRLDEEERFLLSRLSWLEQEGVKQIEEYVSVTEGQLTTLRNLTRSLENRLQAPSMELLEGINDILGRYDGHPKCTMLSGSLTHTTFKIYPNMFTFFNNSTINPLACRCRRPSWPQEHVAKGPGRTETSVNTLTLISLALDCIYHSASIPGTSSQVLPAHTLSLNLQLRSTYLHRGKEFVFHNPTPVPLNLEKKISEAKARHESIIESLKESIDILITEWKEDKSTFLNSLDKKDKENWYLLQKNNSELLSSVPVTLDSTSADPNLTFSQDLKKASLYLVDSTLNTQAKPRQLYPFHCVRGSPGLSSGLGVWEVKIQGLPGRVCIVGVVAELPQGSQIQNSESCCLWALKISSSGCQPITNVSIQENLSICLRKVGVYVDYDRGDVVFYDATTNKHIYTFQTSFDRQVFPFFGLQTARSSITLSL
ncbi:E3 ubiquitin-protein ligase TRIM31-like [Arvicola amphibius]|uniref:E3 ubiquitin-protein ligase TRIM31-like n=1 Tax=Arvicola amphibius TaxID=1047088 RepID=UPI001C08B11C|nr:E3 ubiquitin-protein ligase TRIM31-like [Arvicola amphibius]